MQFVYKEMACDRAKSNVAKWNLNGKMQLKHVKNSLISIKLFSYVMECKLFGVCVVRKGAEKRFNFKIIR